MVARRDLFHLPFYKKEAFTGSDRGLRFWIGKTELAAGERTETVLRTVAWPEPFAMEHTADEKKTVKDFAFSEEGLDEAYGWLLGEGRDEALAKAGEDGCR